MSAPVSFGAALVETAKKVSAAEKAVGSGKTDVEEKQAEIDALSSELKTLSAAQAKNAESYKAAIGELKSVVDAEHERLNPPSA